MQSVLTDCPDREKGPYTGDNLHNIDTELTLFDMQAYQGQMVNNMRTAQRPGARQRAVPGADRQHRARVPLRAAVGDRDLVPGRAQLGRRRDHDPVEPVPGLRRHQGHEGQLRVDGQVARLGGDHQGRQQRQHPRPRRLVGRPEHDRAGGHRLRLLPRRVHDGQDRRAARQDRRRRQVLTARHEPRKAEYNTKYLHTDDRRPRLVRQQHRGVQRGRARRRPRPGPVPRRGGRQPRGRRAARSATGSGRARWRSGRCSARCTPPDATTSSTRWCPTRPRRATRSWSTAAARP